MSTRRAAPGSPTSYGKYMSDPAFVSARPVSAHLVLPKALLHGEGPMWELLFFIQGLSMQWGGLRALARKLIWTHPERCREDESPRANELRLASLMSNCQGGSRFGLAERTEELLGDFLAEFLVNPRIGLYGIDCPCFAELDQALTEYKASYEAAALRKIVRTASSEILTETLDQALSLKRMVIVEGNAGAGKSTLGQAFCATKMGKARYVTLKGVIGKTTFFQTIGRALGLPICQKSALKVQTIIEDYFARSKMMLVIDEAHYLWPQSVRGQAVPELVNWVNTALVNEGVPVALLCTDQFSKLKNRTERVTGWSGEQLQRRTFRYRKLADKPSLEDVEAVTRMHLSCVWSADEESWIPTSETSDEKSASVLARYSMERDTPFDCALACIEEARIFAIKDGRSRVSRADLATALKDGQMPSDENLIRAFDPSPAERRGRRSSGSKGKPYVSPAASAVFTSPQTESPATAAPARQSEALGAPRLALQTLSA